jgi:hypothetical protein
MARERETGKYEALISSRLEGGKVLSSPVWQSVVPLLNSCRNLPLKHTNLRSGARVERESDE